ncbi:MAG: hypothetical protein A2Y21_06115 [Clostridiales bacterium GWC2_40_7]|nr:MAG: hypothetical protein A2Y21_06115 [Clostridiales bacterium GWC2_40_7]
MRIYLNDDWLVRHEELNCGVENAAEVMDKTEEWLKTNVPCDIREPLIREGIIREPLEGMNCFDSEWVESKSWWLKKSFHLPVEILSDDKIELNLDSLDYGAEVFLNGQWIGRQLSSFYPFRKEVKKLLKAGQNDLLVRLTTGLERVKPEDMQEYIMTTEEDRRPGRGDKRKGFLRKPQYTFGWDWNPRVSTCGIMKDVWLESYRKAAIRWVRTWTKALQPEARLGFVVEIENFHPFSTQEADLCVSLFLDGAPAAEREVNILLRSGITPVEMDLAVPEARLWWPNGMGRQPLYAVQVSITVNGKKTEYPFYQYGIRTVELDMSRVENGERLFAFVINGKRVFCKGANWIPADSLYGRVRDKRYNKLICEAKEANFNMLRIWGGGLYERDVFYQLCNRHGILLWHDFMFACSEYPDNQQWFVDEVEKEVDYQTRRLCNHPAMALWCGNNEIHWGFDEWWKATGYFGSRIYNYIAPAVVRRNCPEIPYWNSSPYGGKHPNGSDVGDRHHWLDCMMNEDMHKRIIPEEYDKVTAKFVSEYGYIGPLKPSSVAQYLDGAPFDITGEVWQHHNNTFEKDTVVAGIRYHYTDPETLNIDSYLLYAGLCQGLMYAYSLEAFRYKKDCSGGLFWMYNDCWGETGWTIIDYYMRRKISYYFVKRALAPVKIILREDKGVIDAAGINETPEVVELNLEYGYTSYDGSIKEVKTTVLGLQPFSREYVLSFPKGLYDDKKGIYFIKAANEKVLPALLRTQTYRESEVPLTIITVQDFQRIGSDIKLIVSSCCYAHAVHFSLSDDVKLSDEYFDLMPGEKRQIWIYNAPEGLEMEKLKPRSVNT